MRSKRRSSGKRYAGPVVAPSAVRAFLERPLRSFAWLKQVPKEELLSSLPKHDGFRFHTDPWESQAACFTIATSVPQFLFFLDVGAGKSKIVLDALWFRRLRNGKPKRILVLVQSDTNFDSWMDQVAEHRPEFKFVALDGAKDKRFETIEENHDADVFVLNYDGLMSFITHLSNKRSGREIDYKMAELFAGLFDAIVLDEIHNVGNKASLRFRMVAQLCKYIPIRYGMTGTPFGRNPEKLWSQFYLIDGGATLGPTLTLYRAAFFDAKENYVGGFDYEFREGMSDQLHRTLAHSSIRYDDRELGDAPKVKYIKHPLTFGVDAVDYYARVRDEFLQSKKAGSLREMESSFLRMRQACAGFLSVRPEDGSDSVRVPFVTNPKLQELESLIDSLPETEKVMVFHEFIPSGDAICEMLARRRVKHVRAGGGKSAGRSALAVKRFKDDASVRVLVAGNSSGATTGTNPYKVCRRIVFFDCPDDPIVRKQAEGRLRPRLNPRRCYVHDFAIRKSIDETVLGFIREGRALFAAIVNGEEVRL